VSYSHICEDERSSEEGDDFDEWEAHGDVKSSTWWKAVSW
jgi:hypothetical protein